MRLRLILTLFLVLSSSPGFAFTNNNLHHVRSHSNPLIHSPRIFTARPVLAIPTVIQTAVQSSGVQKVLELGVVASMGVALRDQLDAKATTAILLNALVPAVIVSSLSALTLSPEMGLVLLSGVALAFIQLGAGELASRFVLPKESSTLRRTAALQLGTMAPALSVFSFTREFVGASFAGLAALADVPTKLYTLLLIPYYLRFRGDSTESDSAKSTTSDKPSLAKRLSGIVSDPFNLAITSGLVLAALGKPVATLGFFGKAIGSLAQAQTAILFLLIGLKLKIGGDRPKLCLRLLFARHGFCSLAVSAFLAIFMGNAGADPRLAAVLSSHAACSIIAFGQMSKVDKAGVKGYDTDLAFDIVAMSFPFTVLLNTVACLAGSSYVDTLPAVGVVFLALSAAIGKLSP